MPRIPLRAAAGHGLCGPTTLSQPATTPKSVPERRPKEINTPWSSPVMLKRAPLFTWSSVGPYSENVGRLGSGVSEEHKKRKKQTCYSDIKIFIPFACLHVSQRLQIKTPLAFFASIQFYSHAGLLIRTGVELTHVESNKTCFHRNYQPLHDNWGLVYVTKEFLPYWNQVINFHCQRRIWLNQENF